MNTLLITALALASSEVTPTVKLNWYGVVPAVVNKTEFTQLHLTYEVNLNYQVKLVKLDI